jgi:pilus assembly protein CpaE
MPDSIITILLVDDNADARMTVRKILSFERDFNVVGMAATGYEGLALARQLLPDIVVIDINLPDIDGLQVTTQIVDGAPGTGVIIMSVQDDASYMRRAMMAGAKAFVTKSVSPDQLYNTIRTVYKRAPTIQALSGDSTYHGPDTLNQGSAGNIVVVYSPQGGAGCTTVATNLASGLMREGARVLLVDANLQFGDVGVFLNLQAQSTMADMAENVEDLDTDFFEHIVLKHNSGLHVLLGPPQLETAQKMLADSSAVSKILSKIRWGYDFIVVDTSLHLDDMALSLMDMASRIVLVSTSTLASIKNVRSVLDLFGHLDYPQDKIMLVINRVSPDRAQRKLNISAQKIAAFLKHPIHTLIPLDEYVILDAMRKGVTVVASQRDRTKSPVKELLSLCDSVHEALLPQPLEINLSPSGKRIIAKT